MLETKVTSNLSPAIAKLRTFERRIQGDLVRRIGVRIGLQERRRIKSEKESPEGRRWEDRSSGGNWPLLVKSGAMLASVQYKRVDTMTSKVGPNVEYARYVNALRKFVGLSSVNLQDLEDLIKSWTASKLQ